LFGKGVPVDAKKALSLYQKAAEQGNDVAMVSLGMMYYRGMGVSQNSEEAIKWWKKARKKGNENAILILKKILENK
jgi:TPR repeat protein